MSKEELAAVASEIAQLTREANDATLIVADSKVREVVRLDRLEHYLARRRFKAAAGPTIAPCSTT